jgi:beta-glucosidase
MKGDEVVQVYVSHVGVDGAPIRSLAGLQRVTLERGGQTTVEFTLSPRELSVVDAKGVRKVSAGTIDLWVGGGQPVTIPGLPKAAGVASKLTVTGETVVPD